MGLSISDVYCSNLTRYQENYEAQILGLCFLFAIPVPIFSTWNGRMTGMKRMEALTAAAADGRIPLAIGMLQNMISLS